MNVVRDAVVLAAGRGTRLGSLTEDVPKPMLPIAGRPLLEHVFDSIRSVGVDRLTVITGYRAEAIEEHFGDGSRFDVEVTYRRQTVTDGTARALLLARDAVGDNPFVLVWGDILVPDENYAALLDLFTSTDATGVLAVQRVDDPSKGGAITLDGENRIATIVEKPPPGTADTDLINAGIGVFRPVIFRYLAEVKPSPRGEYEIPDALNAMIADGLELRAQPLAGEWVDVGTPEDLEKARRLLE